ncbi:MAG: hypothetical protein LBM19_02600 [Holosporales bacterium]|jgi:hypothetical protein|nr:hypothetical protein [Holosporales bacterium]
MMRDINKGLLILLRVIAAVLYSPLCYGAIAVAHWDLTIGEATYRTQREADDVRVIQADIPMQTIATRRQVTGVLLYVNGFVPDGATSLKRVYYSGNAPYKNEPPSFTLARRTMLDMLAIGDGFTRMDAVELTYEGKLVDILDTFTNGIDEDVLTMAVALLKEALEAINNTDTNAVYRAGLLEIAGQLCNSVYTDIDVAVAGLGAALPARDPAGLSTLVSNLSPLIAGARTRVGTLKSTYEGKLTAYKSRQDGRYNWITGWNKDRSATHAEIMFLDDVFRLHHEYAGSGVERVMKRIQNGGIAIPNLMFLTKPMCQNCEPAIVKAWEGVPGTPALTVVSEKEPSAQDLARDVANVVKIYVPAS